MPGTPGSNFSRLGVVLVCALVFARGGVAGVLSQAASPDQASNAAARPNSASAQQSAAPAVNPPPSQPGGDQTTAEPAQPAIRVTVPYVDVPVLVLDARGTPLSGLPAQAFQVSDDGAPQRIMAFEGEPRPITLGIVVDTAEPEAVAQAKRAAEVVANMVVGASGQGAVFIAGPEPRQVLPFTHDRNQLADALRHLQVNANGPDITTALQLSITRVRQQPRDDTRAVLVISKQGSRGGRFAEAIVEASMNDAIPVFRIDPNRPKNPPPNPVSTDNNGPGPGSSREPPHVPTGAEQPIPQPAPGTYGNINLGPLLGKVIGALKTGGVDYVAQTGGLTLHPASDGAFDRDLSSVGDALRGVYHVFYRPSDLTPEARLHNIGVRISRKGVKKVVYRRTYVGVSAR